ncbi:hypothetical protein, partial [Paenibacillus durus]|uniref:hypothetical protein n=1 Tax=Paenibacillus durus TaxID=44251 RepID=UPI001B80D449
MNRLFRRRQIPEASTWLSGRFPYTQHTRFICRHSLNTQHTRSTIDCMLPLPRRPRMHSISTYLDAPSYS